jgi:hypothetical protein
MDKLLHDIYAMYFILLRSDTRCVHVWIIWTWQLQESGAAVGLAVGVKYAQPSTFNWQSLTQGIEHPAVVRLASTSKAQRTAAEKAPVARDLSELHCWCHVSHHPHLLHCLAAHQKHHRVGPFLWWHHGQQGRGQA